MFNNMWDVKEPKHYSKRVGREVPGVVAVLCVVNTGPMLIAVTTITEMVILYKYVEIIIMIIIIFTFVRAVTFAPNSSSTSTILLFPLIAA